jgi:DNA-binding NarL/FixJ family response regulator
MTAPVRARIAVCCLNRLLREAIARIVAKRAEFDIVAINSAPDSPDPAASISEIDVLVLDSLGAFPRVASIQQDKGAGQCPVKCVLVSMDDNPDQFMTAIEMGVRGYVLRDASASDVLCAIRAVALGEAVCPPSYTRLLFDYVAGRTGKVDDRNKSASFSLTRREQQLIPLIGSGKTNKEIANRLNISEQTVKNHVHRIMKKMQVPNRLEVCKAWQKQSGLSTYQNSGYSFEYSPS